MLSSGKFHDLGSAARPVYCDVSKYLIMADSKLFNRIQSLSHCLTHLHGRRQESEVVTARAQGAREIAVSVGE